MTPLRSSSVPELGRLLALLALLAPGGLLTGCSDATGPEEEAREEVRAGWRSVDAGTCALTLGREAFCWGFDGTGPFGGPSGRLGQGRPVRHVLSPEPVVGGPRFERIDLGRAHTCALTPEGEAFCWGNNDEAQLGNGEDPRNRPIPVDTDLTFRQISGGGKVTCAITTEGRALCWGQNFAGQLGDGTETDRAAPTPVDTELRFEQIRAGGVAPCALTSAGEAFCWGFNTFGALGDGTTTDRLMPVAVSGGLTFRQISPARGKTCGVTVDDELFCWGAGPIGDGTDENRLVPTRIPFPEE